MPPLNVPDRYRPGLAAIMDLSHGTVNKLAVALSKAPSDASTVALSEKIRPGVPDLSDETLSSIISTVLSLYSLRAHTEQTAQELAQDIIDTVSEDEFYASSLSNNNLDNIREKLTRLLSVDQLTYPWKTLDVMTEYERQFHSARIITDIRTVFSTKPDSDPIGAEIMHMLRLSYHEGGGMKDIFIALDDDSIQELRDVIDRAEMKANKLRTMIDRIGFHRA